MSLKLDLVYMTLIGIIGGSGLYSLDGLRDVETVELNTPFGTPSSPVTIGSLTNACSINSPEGAKGGRFARNFFR